MVIKMDMLTAALRWLLSPPMLYIVFIIGVIIWWIIKYLNKED